MYLFKINLEIRLLRTTLATRPPFHQHVLVVVKAIEVRFDFIIVAPYDLVFLARDLGSSLARHVDRWNDVVWERVGQLDLFAIIAG